MRIYSSGHPSQLVTLSLILLFISACRSIPAEYLRRPAAPDGNIPIKVQFQRSNWNSSLKEGLGIISDLDVITVKRMIEPKGKDYEDRKSEYVLNILIRKIKLKMELGWTPVGLVFSSMLLLGFPIIASDYTLSIEGKLFHKGKPVALFLEKEQKKKFAALYWGYSIEGAHKTAFLGALHQAVTSIRSQASTYVAKKIDKGEKNEQ